MKQTVSNQMGDGHIVKQDFTAYVRLLQAIEHSQFSYKKGMTVAAIILEEVTKND